MIWRLGAWFSRATLLWALATVMLVWVGHVACAEAPRIVPQLGITSLDPVKVALSPDFDSPDALLVVNRNGRIDLYDISRRERIKMAEIEAGAQHAVFSPDRQTLVSGGIDGEVRLWTREGEASDEPLTGHEGAVTSVSISADGQTIVSGGVDGTVRLWSHEGEPRGEPLRGHEGWVWTVAISADGQTIVSGGENATVLEHSLAGGQPRWVGNCAPPVQELI